MKTRQEIRELKPESLRSFRDAWRQMEMTKAFQCLAGIHGLPNKDEVYVCPHHTFEFLPWHRLYLVALETLLEKHGFDQGLPYWRWTQKTSTSNGLPTAFTDAYYESADGSSCPNPLMRGWIEFEKTFSKRYGHLRPDENEELRSREADAFRARQFWSERGTSLEGFSNLIEDPHDTVHSYVGRPGGAMFTCARASYDPIFWAHHSFVDQQWASWQSFPTSAPLPNYIATAQVRHFNQPISSTLDYEELGYKYDRLETPEKPPSPLGLDTNGSIALLDVPFRGSPSLSLTVTIGGLRMVNDSLSLHVFIGKHNSGSTRPARNDPRYVRTIHLFGMGGVTGPGMFKGEFTRHANIGPALASIGAAAKNVSIFVVAEDTDGKQIDLRIVGSELCISGI